MKVGTGAAEARITRLLHDYVRAIDDDRLEEWPDFFVEDCVYKIVPRENMQLEAQLPIFYCENKNMLHDRVMALRSSSIYNLHYDRHLISNISIVDEADGLFHVHSNYAVYHTDLIEGQTILFSVGKYEDEIVFVGNEPKFKKKVVVLDTSSIINELSTPI